MVYVPSPPTAPAPPAPDYDATEELRINRLNTSRFIAADPLILTLRTRTVSRAPSGARNMHMGAERPIQRFKLIEISPAGGSIEQHLDSGIERLVTYVLLGEWDAEVDVGDWWDDELGQRWEVKSINPTNGYEVRANVEARGRLLVGG